MIRIKELFRLQNIKRLRLIAGQEGMEHTVTAAVLFEYDPSRMQLSDFYRGDLVVTTLAYARGDAKLVAHSLTALMRQGVAGLLIKTAYFSELPDEVVALADELGTPLFLFDDTYIEEVILEVTDLIRGKRHFAGYERELEALMRTELSADAVRERLHRIDPVGSSLYRVFALSPVGHMMALEDAVYALVAADAQVAQRYVFMEWQRMLLVLAREDEQTGQTEQEDALADMRALMNRAGVAADGVIIGASEGLAEPAAIRRALLEAVYAARAARLMDRGALSAGEMGIYAYLLPMSENAFVCDQCRRMMGAVQAYDAQNRSNLAQTARIYVREGMEISATAKALFQHPNTVRYRLGKIQKLMGLEDEALFAPMLSMVIHLSAILEEESRL